MRINICDKEITGQVQAVSEVDHDAGRTFIGLRIFLASPAVLYSDPDDDDRSAVTFWYERGAEQERSLVITTLIAAAAVAP